jgi:hypothetical protein
MRTAQRVGGLLVMKDWCGWIDTERANGSDLEVTVSLLLFQTTFGQQQSRETPPENKNKNKKWRSGRLQYTQLLYQKRKKYYSIRSVYR